MKISQYLKYYLNVKLIGNNFLRYQRIKASSKKAIPSKWRIDILAPPLRIGAKTKELIAKHYLEGQFVSGVRPVAWVTSGAPVEILKTLGYYVLYPENHAALCGARRRVVDISSEAEKAGYSRDICSYARTDIGATLSKKTPVGRLPKPDLLLACTNICQTVLSWYRVLAHYYNVPLALIDTPFIYDKLRDHDIEYVKKQLEDLITIAERISKRKFSYDNFMRVAKYSKEATELWLEIMECCKHRPAPISVFDQFIQMAPIVEMRGQRITVDFYWAMLREIKKRISKGIGAVKNERKRLLWDNLPIWYKIRYLSEYFGEKGISIVASTYTNAWGELASLIDYNKPLESMAKTYLNPILNHGPKYKLNKMKKMIDEYHIDGVILHSDRSCKPYSIGQIDQRNIISKESDLPSLLLEADHNDPRAYADLQVEARLYAFVEMLN